MASIEDNNIKDDNALVAPAGLQQSLSQPTAEETLEPLEPSEVITSDVLNSDETLLNTPTITTQTGAEGFSSFLESSNNSTKTTSAEDQERLDREAEQAEEKESLDSTIQSILDLNTDIGTASSRVSRREQDEARKEVDRLTSELEAEQNANRRRIERLRNENPEGLFGGGLEQEVGRINRISLSKQADLAILQNAALRRFDTSKAIADRELEFKLEADKARLENLKFVFEANKADFDKEETRLYEEEIARQEREFNKKEALETSIKDIKLIAAQNQAPVSVLNALSQAKTLDEALAAVGGYLMSPKEKLELQKLRGDIAINAAELAKAKGILEGASTGDPILDIITASAQYGDQRITDSQLKEIQQATNALGSMESLQAMLSEGNDGLNLTGPLAGRTRTLFTQMGGDAKASAINATIQGLIPTVARGIFGEVGVLTDADIANYRKTVPNLTSTAKQNELISLVMYDVLSRSLASTLTTNAQNQANVSGFASTYSDATRRIANLKADLGVVEEAPIDPINETKMQSAWSETVGNTITSQLNALSQ